MSFSNELNKKASSGIKIKQSRLGIKTPPCLTAAQKQLVSECSIFFAAP